PDGNVMMDVAINKDAVSAVSVQVGLSSIPAIDTKRVTTSVLVENGGTVVIGGIYSQEERNQVNKIPILGDLPAVGRLFRNNFRIDDKTELLVFLTPRIVEERVSVR
ncbi:MAG TPA: type IV pilus secretin PilQ, partial [Burkholderiales bacterium]|nr:type IV pilus secretin PilQ [Burkholderiales bacterium]